ncbi:unnamed protein product [Sphacelaria rigidula]
MVLFLPRDEASSDEDAADRPSEKQQNQSGAVGARGGEEAGKPHLSGSKALLSVNQALCTVAAKRGGKQGGETQSRFRPASQITGNPEIRNVSFINARTPMVTMVVGNVVVDVTENQGGSVAASVLMEAADMFIQRNHLFKRSLLLIKAWALCETPRLVGQCVLGAREGGLTTYGLSVMVLHLFHSRSAAESLLHPFDVLIRFFQVFADFDWGGKCLTLDGPVAFDERGRLSGNTRGMRGCRLWPLVEKVSTQLSMGPTEKTPRIRAKRASRFARRSDGHDRASRPPLPKADVSPAAHFPKRDCNIQDPLNPLNNLGHSVSRRTLKALEHALQSGRRLLEESDLWPGVTASRRRRPQPEAHDAGRLREEPSGNLYGEVEGAKGERGHGNPVAYLDPPMIASPAPPHVAGGQMPVFSFQQVAPAHRVMLGSPPSVPALSHVMASGGLQYCVAQPQPLLQLVPPLGQLLYDPFSIPDGRVLTHSAAIVGSAGPGQVLPPGTMLFSSPGLEGPGDSTQPLLDPHQQHIGEVDAAVHRPRNQEVQMSQHVTVAELSTRPHSAPWRDGHAGRNVNSGANDDQDTAKRRSGTAARDHRPMGRAKQHDEDQSRRRPTSAPMLPWKLPKTAYSSPSSTASMSEPAEDGSKDEQERHSACDSGADEESHQPLGMVRQAGPSWPNEDSSASSHPRSGSHSGDGGRGQKAKKGGGGGNGSKKGSSLWANWFLRDFFPQCCQLYGTGDGFREDLLDHPCQHWSNHVRPAEATLRPGSEDVLTGVYPEMCRALENVGQMMQGVSTQPHGIEGKETESKKDQATVRRGQHGACKADSKKEANATKSDTRLNASAGPSTVITRVQCYRTVMTSRSSSSQVGVGIVWFAGELLSKSDRSSSAISRQAGTSRQTKSWTRQALREPELHDESGSTTSEEQGEKRESHSAPSPESPAHPAAHSAPTPFKLPMMVDVDTSPESAVDFVSVSASTQTQSTSIVCSKGSEKAVQCTFPKRGVPISCGNQCGTPIRDMVSAGVQCCAEDVHHTSVGTQCSFPAAEAEQPAAPTTAEVGTETDIITELPVQSTHRTSLNDESTDVKGLHIPSCSSLESSVSRTRKVNDESVAPVATTASPGSDDDEVAVPVVVVDDSAVPKGKKNKRKKHKSASRTPESSDRPVACNAAKSQSWTASTWPAVSPAMKLIRACVPVLMCSLAILLGGVWMGTYLGGAAEVDTYASAFPREASQSYGHMERQTRPPMWVAAGSSLTLGDVWAPRAEQGDVFEWFKDGKLLPGRTSSFLTISMAGIEDEGTYSCFVAGRVGAQHIPLWDEATVRISEPPSVENQLQTQRLARGEMLAIVATASGVPQPQYQWRRNGVPIPGATRPMLVRHSVTEADMGTYTCDVFNVAGRVQWEEMAVILRDDRDARKKRRERHSLSG